jgi:hypothetical protein
MKTLRQDYELSYDPTLQALLLTWREHPTREQIRLAASQATDLIAQHSIAKILNNQSALSDLTFDNDDWVADTWFPQVVDGGIRQYAVVVSPAIYQELPEGMRQNKTASLQIMYFTQEQQAKAWLLSH